MPSSTSNTQHPTPVQPIRGTACGNASANQTAHATRPYTNIVACNGSFDVPAYAGHRVRRSSSMEVLVEPNEGPDVNRR
ncbi:hypothetical protein B5807_10896 [Epicoccum nigrum]|uniref:Uncharacterized protein n=1 Tax=Epicoccum nigrum TaxID=105696 RepID=A0A1Y2LKX0_EPING|nr:hypothetical protein B5807_10896 [Epicoccum nigrum]